MPPELISQRRDHPHRECLVVARIEAGEERPRDHTDIDAAVDRFEHGPAAFARVVDVSAQVLEARVTTESELGQLEQPGANHAASVPELGDLLEVVLELLGGLEEVESFRV